MRIMLTGPLGSGKTTQGNILAEKLGVCLIRMGDLIRARAAVQDEIGKAIEERISQGHLIDDKLAAEIVQKEINQPKCASGFVLDGYPRSVGQLREFEPELDVVIYMILTEAEINRRLTQRQRSDDLPLAIQNRLKWFREETQKVIEYYENKGKLIRIDADQPIEKITEEIVAFAKNYE